jgi:hypothetical protein
VIAASALKAKLIICRLFGACAKINLRCCDAYKRNECKNDKVMLKIHIVIKKIFLN